MTNIRETLPTALAAATVLLLVAFPASYPSPIHAESVNPTNDRRGHGVTGTWFMTTPAGLTGLYSIHSDGTVTGVVSNIAGAPPQGAGPATDGSGDYGIWRRVRGGFEMSFFRFRFDPVTGDPTQVSRHRTSLALDPGGNSGSGTFIIDRWECPTALTCPDPNVTSPDVANISPPPPFNTFTVTRVRVP